MDLNQIKEQLTKLKGRRDQVKSDIDSCKDRIDQLKSDLEASEQAQAIIQAVAKQTQEELKHVVEPPVNKALEAVLDRPYEFELRFTTKAGRTQAQQIYKRQGREYKNLMFSGGGGAQDTAALGLQVSGLYLTQLRRFLLLDEPLKHLKSRDKRLEKRGAMVMQELSHELGLQILMISHIPEQQKGSDKIFRFELDKNEITQVEEVND